MQKQNNVEDQIFKLKLQWMMAKDDAERKKVSDEIRRLLQSASSK